MSLTRSDILAANWLFLGSIGGTAPWPTAAEVVEVCLATHLPVVMLQDGLWSTWDQAPAIIAGLEAAGVRVAFHIVPTAAERASLEASRAWMTSVEAALAPYSPFVLYQDGAESTGGNIVGDPSWSEEVYLEFRNRAHAMIPAGGVFAGSCWNRPSTLAILDNFNTWEHHDGDTPQGYAAWRTSEALTWRAANPATANRRHEIGWIGTECFDGSDYQMPTWTEADYAYAWSIARRSGLCLTFWTTIRKLLDGTASPAAIAAQQDQVRYGPRAAVFAGVSARYGRHQLFGGWTDRAAPIGAYAGGD